MASSSSTSVARPCYPLTPHQLRAAHDLDWKCVSRIFGLPLRKCCINEPEYHGVQHVTDAAFSDMLLDIEKCWNQMALALEVFFDENKPDLGWRLRVRQDYPLRQLYIPPSRPVVGGWSAQAVMEGPTSHLYKRSPIEVSGYLGGPLSLANRSPSSKIQVTKHKDGPDHYVVLMSSVSLEPGQEFLWSYGLKHKNIADHSFPQCCTEIQTTVRRPRLPQLQIYHEKESASSFCLLCGMDLTSKSKTRSEPSNFKLHYARNHIDYFKGDGPVVWDKVMVELEVFRLVIADLRRRKFKIIPCCKVDFLLSGGTPQQKFMSFRSFYNQFRDIGLLLLKGDKPPSYYDDLKPLNLTSWDDVQWSSKRPPVGDYTVAKNPQVEKDMNERAITTTLSILSHRFQ